MNYLHLEAGPIGSTITRWPRNTRFFSSPEWIAIAGVPIQAHGGAAKLVVPGEELEIASDFVYLATGFEMDQSLYEQLGITTSGEERKPTHDPKTMESNVPGVYIVGTSTGGNQKGYKVFITTSHAHCVRAARDYPLSSKDVE